MNNLNSFLEAMRILLEAIFVKNGNTDKILNEVKKKRQRAEQLGLPNLINDIYNHVKCFSSNSDYMPSIISSCIRIDSKIIFELNNRQYTFNCDEGKSIRGYDQEYINTNIELIFNDNKIFALNITKDIIRDKYLGYLESNPHFTINAFKEGNWVKDFRELKKQIDIASKIRLEKQAEKQKMDYIKKLKQLKSDFDIK
ncbi:MAG TPA: hypothetical protein DDZ41_07680 [Flavobacterium sp.]|nr:hypothetical protein [Flavobacterium sp.]